VTKRLLFFTKSSFRQYPFLREFSIAKGTKRELHIHACQYG